MQNLLKPGIRVFRQNVRGHAECIGLYDSRYQKHQIPEKQFQMHQEHPLHILLIISIKKAGKYQAAPAFSFLFLIKNAAPPTSIMAKIKT